MCCGNVAAQSPQPPQYPCRPTERPHRTPEEEADKHTEMMKRDLSLTEEQVALIFQIHLNFVKKKRVAQSREEVISLVKQLNESLKLVLTPEQYMKHQQHQQEVRNRRHGRTEEKESPPVRIIQPTQ